MIKSTEACCPCYRDTVSLEVIRCSFSLNQDPAVSAEPCEAFIFFLPSVIWFFTDRCRQDLFLHSSFHSINTEAAASMEQPRYFHYLMTACTLLACQPVCLSEGAPIPTPPSALYRTHYFWSLPPSGILFTILLLQMRKGKLGNLLSKGPKSLNIWTKIQIQISLLNISPLFQSTLFFFFFNEKRTQATFLNNRRSAITRRRFLERNSTYLISKIHKYQREVGKSQLGVLLALYSALIINLCWWRASMFPLQNKPEGPLWHLKVTQGFVISSLGP